MSITLAHMRNEWVSDLVIEEILRDFPDQIADRRRKLADPQWRAAHPEAVRSMHDPDRTRRLVATLQERNNPFSATNLMHHASELEWRMLNTTPAFRYVMRNPDTGEVVYEAQFQNNVDPSDPSARAYVAELN